MKSEDNSTSNNNTNGVKASGIQQSIGVGVPAHPPQLSSTHNSLQSNPLATAYLHPNPAMAALQNTPNPGFGYHFPEYMDQRGLGLSRNSFEAFADFNTMRLQQHYLQQQQQQRLAEKLQASNNPNGPTTTPNSNNSTVSNATPSATNSSVSTTGVNNPSSNSSSNGNNSNSGIVRPPSPSNNGVDQQQQQQQQNKGMGIVDDRYQILYEREARWSEVRKYSEFIRRFAMEASHVDVTKDNYYDLYNMAVCLLKSVDSLDPDKIQPSMSNSQVIAPPPPPLPLSSGRKNSEFDFSSHLGGSSTALNALLTHQPDYEFLQARKSFDYYFNRGSIESSNLMNREIPSMYYNNPNSVNVTGPYMNNNMLSQYPPPPPHLSHLAHHPPLPSNNMANSNTKAMLMENLKQHHSKNYTGEVFFDDLSNASSNPTNTSSTNTTTTSANSNSTNNIVSSNSTQGIIPPQTPGQSSPSSTTSPNDSSQDDPRRPKRRRRRTVYSSRRNLHCHMCGVTETPEWRRGPAGDHTYVFNNNNNIGLIFY